MIDIKRFKGIIDKNNISKKYGEIISIKDQLLISKGPICKIGDLCFVGGEKVPCEVISLEGNHVYMLPMYDAKNIMIKDEVYSKSSSLTIPKVENLINRVINGFGEFIDNKDKHYIDNTKDLDLNRKPPSSMDRRMIEEVMPTGIKAIDGLLTIGEGQRIGVFAGTGVGKTTLLGMMAKYAKADINIIALVGERGREVKKFIEDELGPEGMKRSVVIVATSDESDLMKIKAAQLATSIAEEYRDKGKKVLLMMDSVSRFAKAKMKIDMATGELAPGGKTPSMETSMQRLLERAGMGKVGSITGIYTVLVDGDDMNDPIADVSRGILDGHIILSREIANYYYPAIDVLNSKSRVMQDIVTNEHQMLAREINKYMSMYKKIEDAITFGSYERGRNKEADLSVLLHEPIQHFLTQQIEEKIEYGTTVEMMREMLK